MSRGFWGSGVINSGGGGDHAAYAVLAKDESGAEDAEQRQNGDC